MRLPVQDRRTQSLRPVATPSQGQPGVSGASLVGQALTEAAKIADQGQKIYNAYQAARIQDLLNQLEHEAGERWLQLQQMRGYNAVLDGEGGYEAQINALEELRNSQIQQLPAHLQRKYRIASDRLLNREKNRFKGYALEQSRAARREVNQTAEKNALDKAASASSFEEVQEIVDDLFWLTDDDGNRTMGSTLRELVLEGVPQELIDRHEKELRAKAHLSSISNQITAAREQRDVGLIVSAQEHLEKAREFLPVDVYNQAKERIEKERDIVTAESIFENILAEAVMDSPDEDARFVDEVKLAELINSIEDRNLRSLVWKLANEHKPIRDAQKKEVTKQYTSRALKVFWDTRSKDAAQRSPAMLWLERNDLDSWLRVNKEMENWEYKWKQQGIQERRNIIELQSIEARNPDNLFMLRLLQEDILRNPQKYAAENYDLNSLMDEWGGRIPIGLHDKMNNYLLQHKARWPSEEHKNAQERFQNALRERSPRFETHQERLEFVGVMYSLYNEVVASGKKITPEEIDKIIRRADTIVISKRRIFPNQTMTYAEALVGGFKISQHQDPNTGEWVDGPPPSGTSGDANVRAGGVASPDDPQAAPGGPQAAPGGPQAAPAPSMDPLEARARRHLGLGPNDSVDPEDLEEAMRILKQLDDEEERRGN